MPANKDTLSFVAYEQATGFDVPDTKKQIRAQAARVGWSARKESGKTARQSSGVSKRSKTQSITYQLEVFDVAAPEQSHFGERPGFLYHATTTNPQNTESTATSLTTSPSPTYFSGNKTFTVSRPRPYSADDVVDDSQNDSVEEIHRTRPSSPYFHVVLNQNYVLCDHIGIGADPCWSLPVKWRPFYGTVADYWQNTISQVMQNEIQTGFEGADKKTRVMDLLNCAIETNSPALFYGFFIMVISMLPAKHPLSCQSIPIFASWLRAKAVETLNAAISNPATMYDATTIGAVNCIAFCEGINGNPQVARGVHQQALRKIIVARGGMEEIEASSPYGTYMRLATLQLDRMISSKFEEPFFFADIHDPVIDSTNWTGAWERVQKQLEDLC